MKSRIKAGSTVGAQHCSRLTALRKRVQCWTRARALPGMFGGLAYALALLLLAGAIAQLSTPARAKEQSDRRLRAEGFAAALGSDVVLELSVGRANVAAAITRHCAEAISRGGRQALSGRDIFE